jgi:hypothetical protein
LLSTQPGLQRKCSACEEEEIQRLPAPIRPSELTLRGFWGDGEDKTESNGDSGGGVLDWIREKINDTSSENPQVPEPKTPTQTGIAPAELTPEHDQNADTPGETESAYQEEDPDTTGRKTEEQQQETDEVKDQGASVLTRINSLRQQLAGLEVLQLTESQIATLNGHLEKVRQNWPGGLDLPNISPDPNFTPDPENPGTLPVSASSLENNLGVLGGLNPAALGPLLIGFAIALALGCVSPYAEKK